MSQQWPGTYLSEAKSVHVRLEARLAATYMYRNLRSWERHALLSLQRAHPKMGKGSMQRGMHRLGFGDVLVMIKLRGKDRSVSLL